jgi:hypothetical protein
MRNILLAALAFVLLSASVEAQTYKGCYPDSATRALPNELMPSGATVETCLAAGKAYAFVGLQYGGACFAGNMPGVTKAAETSCNMPCTANTKEKCGGPWFSSVYAVNGIASVKGAGTLSCSTTTDGNATCTGRDTQALGLCLAAPAAGATCGKGDSCFTLSTTTPATTSFFLCGANSKWWKAGPFTAIPN